ncbi:MAG: hypothetical protein U5K43_03940 [Halofilum sp. (in: g-proteobacteria)]|nr:hypothetical protein [Halofilum sp. (in: g-proteobacteria)]
MADARLGRRGHGHRAARRARPCRGPAPGRGGARRARGPARAGVVRRHRRQPLPRARAGVGDRRRAAPGRPALLPDLHAHPTTGRGPRREQFRLAEGELLSLFASLRVLVYREEGDAGDTGLGLRDEAQLVARRPAAVTTGA